MYINKKRKEKNDSKCLKGADNGISVWIFRVPYPFHLPVLFFRVPCHPFVLNANHLLFVSLIPLNCAYILHGFCHRHSIFLRADNLAPWSGFDLGSSFPGGDLGEIHDIHVPLGCESDVWNCSYGNCVHGIVGVPLNGFHNSYSQYHAMCLVGR